MSGRSRLVQPVFPVSNVGFLQYITVLWFLFMSMLVFCYCDITNTYNPPVSLHMGGVNVALELVSLYGQLRTRTMFGFQAQSQASPAELRQFCIIILT